MSEMLKSFAGFVHDPALAAYGEAHYQQLLRRQEQQKKKALEDGGELDADTVRAEEALKQRELAIRDNLVGSQESQIGNLTVPMTELLPGHQRAQSDIALRAWALGQVFSVSILLAVYAIYEGSRLWRPPFFMACLALFHYLEFWTHAKFNLPNATVSAFLLFDNGWPYLAAHMSAMIETTITSLYFPEWQNKVFHPLVKQAGFVCIVVGQLVRSMAIAKAGTNFNHQVQHKKKETHELVTDGIYGVLRHPSYFGFFWWAVGTQIAIGNALCTCVYAFVLWKFFKRRIYVEEKHLIMFFGKDYEFYRSYSRIAIPFIWSQQYPELENANGGDKKSD